MTEGQSIDNLPKRNYKCYTKMIENSYSSDENDNYDRCLTVRAMKPIILELKQLNANTQDFPKLFKKYKLLSNDMERIIKSIQNIINESQENLRREIVLINKRVLAKSNFFDKNFIFNLIGLKYPDIFYNFMVEFINNKDHINVEQKQELFKKLKKMIDDLKSPKLDITDPKGNDDKCDLLENEKEEYDEFFPDLDFFNQSPRH